MNYIKVTESRPWSLDGVKLEKSGANLMDLYCQKMQRLLEVCYPGVKVEVWWARAYMSPQVRQNVGGVEVLDHIHAIRHLAWEEVWSKYEDPKPLGVCDTLKMTSLADHKKTLRIRKSQ